MGGKMVNKSTLALTGVGIVLMALGITGTLGTNIGMMAFVLGFVLTVSGFALSVKETTGVSPKKKDKDTRDNPALIRAAGVGVGLASLATPYFRSPVASDAAATAGSVIDVVTSAAAGVEANISFVVLVLVVVLLAGSFLAVFHHAGGYVMLLGSMTIVFIAMQRFGSLEVVTSELGYGLYLMLFAAFIIISSSFSDTTDAFDSGSDWSSNLLVLR